MEKCFFEVGKTYVDAYREEFKVIEVRPHYPYRSTFSREVVELPEGEENYYDVYIDRPHLPYMFEFYAEKYQHFAQDSIRYDMLVEINKDPKKKDFIVVVPGAYIICDRLEEDPETRDYYEYALIRRSYKKFYHMDRLTKDEKKHVEDLADKIYKELND